MPVAAPTARSRTFSDRYLLRARMILTPSQTYCYLGVSECPALHAVFVTPSEGVSGSGGDVARRRISSFKITASRSKGNSPAASKPPRIFSSMLAFTNVVLNAGRRSSSRCDQCGTARSFRSHRYKYASAAQNCLHRAAVRSTISVVACSAW